jgi:catechol 2,3-dioxygenase-like lactoylglutathione lyase family enzyme
MSSVSGRDFVALQVRDLERAAAFYERRLGLRRARSSPPGAVVFVMEPVAFAVPEPLPGVDLDRLGVVLWLASDDAQGLYDELAAQGVNIITEPFDGPFGRTFVVGDADGYAVTIHNAS